jgi:ribosomal protein S18 acetylase RimI-like enzyme
VISRLNPAFDSTLLSRIEDAGLNACSPSQQRWVDGWLVRFSPAKAKRARCVNAVANGRLPLAERLVACGRLYAEARLPMIVRITPFTQPPELDALLEQHGLRRFDDTSVMVLADLSKVGDVALTGATTMHSIGLSAFAQRVGSLRGSPLAHRQEHADRLLRSPVPFAAFELLLNGQSAACAQFAMEGDLVGLYDVFTAEFARGRGLAQLLCMHMLIEGRNRGARCAYLQVEADNHVARSIYARLGFVDAYAYHYRALDPSAV